MHQYQILLQDFPAFEFQEIVYGVDDHSYAILQAELLGSTYHDLYYKEMVQPGSFQVDQILSMLQLINFTFVFIA